MWKSNNTKMHGLSNIGPNVPAFLIKLWKLVNEVETDEMICWSESGMSFIINQPAQFARELLSVYYKHNNMASFIRQLNMYGFHKIVSETGGLKNEKGYMEFAHQYFIKDHPYLLENIKRKLPNPKSGLIGNEQFTNANMKNGSQSEILAKILSSVNNLKGKQESWDAKLASMKRENEALWRELAIFRQKHLKQEQIINRLIHFIVTMVKPARNVPLRRRYPLMLNDIHPVKKITKLSGASSTSLNQGSPTGPTIHEIDTTDVIFGSPEEPESSTSTEFISSDLCQASPKYVKVEASDNSSVIAKQETEKPSVDIEENIPEDWLEIQMTEGDLIDPLTPINPAEINPAVAAATLKHLEGSNKIATPIAITIPSVTTSSKSGKKNVTEKKIIYLTDINKVDKTLKKNIKKPKVIKLDLNKKSSNNNDDDISSSDLLLDLVCENDETSSKSALRPVTRKITTLVPAPATPTLKAVPARKKINKKADSKSCVPELEIDELDFLLTAKQPESLVADSEGSDITKPSSSVSSPSDVDNFLKLDSLYNGTISEDQLGVSPLKSPLNTEDQAQEENVSTAVEDEKLSVSDLVESGTSKDETENTENVLSFEPDSMAVVCQQPLETDSLTRELSSHVDSVQGELDYLKEMLKGEGYNFDPNSLPWLFNDDPLSYGVLPAADEETNEKKNEEPEVSGNELMTYGAPSLMDLVDMIGSTPSSQDWTVLSPASPAVTDLGTPAPSPSAFSFPSPAKRRKK